jgi:hypothetical protein
MNHYDSKDAEQHFFASCVYGWAVDATPHGAIAKMRRVSGGAQHTKGLRATLVHVPLPTSAPYMIDNYVPKVKGATTVWTGEL